ncbi:Phage tail protein [Cellulomonas sp. KH9]|nr:Phage tail protein [Cellulomonas sp. KH9]
MTLSCTTVEWRGLTLSSDRGSPFGVRSLRGWDELPASRGDSPGRPLAHGGFDTPVWSDERIVTLGGQIVSPDRDALLAELSSVMTWAPGGGSGEDLRITRAGRTLTATARLTAFQTPTDLDWAVGVVPFVIEWRAADPLRYGDTINESTSFPFAAGGLEFPLFTDGVTDTGYLEFGAQGSTGRVTVTNIGTAATSPQFEVTGPTPPFSIVHVESGRRLSFAQSVAAGDRLLIDSATGLVVLNGGDVDYSGMLTRAEWSPVGPGESASFAFIPDGPFADGTLTVIFRPAWW